jgi:hypothetical protein
VKGRFATLLALVAAAAPMAALAEPTQEFRCSQDSLDADQARQRLDWARKCGLLRNTAGPASFFASTRAYDASVFPGSLIGAKEYRENTTTRAYSGNSRAYEVNYYSAYNRFDGFTVYTMAQETSGPTTGFYKWTGTTPRLRPFYPAFGSIVDGSGTLLLPLPTVYDDCNLYQWNPTTGTATRWTGDFYVVAYCEASCYAPDQRVRFADGDVNIVEAMKAKRDDVVTLAPDATLDDLRTQTSKVYSYTTELRDGEHVLFKLTTASGGTLSVTNEHPMVTSEGRLVKAESLKKGDELLKADGTPDPIVGVEKTSHYGKVYNLKPESREHVSNILIAQGYLVGSARFQNDYVAFMNRVLLFRAVPEEVMPR